MKSFPIYFLLFSITATSLSAQSEIQFSRDVQPILSEKCYHCHGPDENTREADLRLDTQAGLFAEGSDGPLIEPGNPGQSEILKRILSDDPDLVMPPPEAKIELSPQQKEQLKGWIEAGAKWEKLWSLVPPKRPVLPTVSNPNWSRNSIDRFIAAATAKAGLANSPPASKTQLLRRVYLDLIGIPPEKDEVDRFLADDSPAALQQVIDRLLASPRYGERMSWEWLDAARYADSNGYQGDRERTMWPWRDWVIDAFNENMPFDQFSRKQIAGDLLPQATPSDRLATGFCRNHMINGEGGRIAEENRVEYIFDQMETVGTVWMGLTFNCCRCHDHKYDPLSQQDYYALFAIFNKTPVNGGGGDPATPPNITVPSFLQERQLKDLDDRLQDLRSTVSRHEQERFKRPQGMPLKSSPAAKGLADSILKILETAPGSRNSKQIAELEAGFSGTKDAVQYVSDLKLLRDVSDRYNALRGQFARVMIMQDTVDRKTFRLDRGLYNQPKNEIEPALPTVLVQREMPSPNRLVLSDWLFEPEQPLTSRVTVNRYWQTFFGTGLVKTPDDFGSQGEKPTHPQLLDWLAVEFAESGWDVKQMHRLIVSSATYQQSPRVNAQAVEIDPDNRLLSYSPRFRMPAWMLRDQVLALSGLLVNQQGGASVRPYQPPGIWAEATFNKKRYVQDHGRNLYRRSLYTFWRRIVGPTMLFDVAKRQTCEVKPGRTNSPLHSLVTLNETVFVESARHLAATMMSQHFKSTKSPERIDSDALISKTFQHILARAPDANELAILNRHFKRSVEGYRKSPDQAEKLLEVGESRLADPTHPVEVAALTRVILLIFNLDECLTR